MKKWNPVKTCIRGLDDIYTKTQRKKIKIIFTLMITLIVKAKYLKIVFYLKQFNGNFKKVQVGNMPVIKGENYLAAD